MPLLLLTAWTVMMTQVWFVSSRPIKRVTCMASNGSGAAICVCGG
jgi:hypothetical protein